MALRCAGRLERLLTSRALTLSLACKRDASSSTVFSPPLSIDAEQPTQASTQPRDPPNPPTRRPKVEEYLQYVKENSNATLADLESFRPKSHAPVGSTEYERQYQALLEKLDRSFTVSQLRQFIGLYGTWVPVKVRKHTAATAIIEKHWGWPSLAKSQKLARARKERSSRVFQLNPQQAFLLLGEDGAEILSLSKTYNVRLQFSRNPLSLTISGATHSVEQLEQHIKTLKEEVIWQDFDPPRRFDLPSSLQQLSQNSGCFLEGISGGKIRIWYRETSSDSPSRAKRLIMQHSIEDVKVPLSACPSGTECSQSQKPPTYALYPFFCESTRSSGNKGHFRLRRVGNWFGQKDNVISHIGDGVTRHYVAEAGKSYASPREQLLAQLGKLSMDCRISVTATPGHVVFNPQGTSVFSLVPPLDGKKNFSDVMGWVREANLGTRFLHGAPMRLWHAPESNQRWRRRLVYETIPESTKQTQMLVCEYAPVNMGAVSVEVDVDIHDIGNIPEPVIRCGPATRLDVLMPDDARDLRLTLYNDTLLPESSWPAELSGLVRDHTSSSNSDVLMFEHEKKKYILKEDTFVQSNSHSIGPEDLSVGITSERRFNPRVQDSYQSYEVFCSKLTSDEAWNMFWDNCEKVVQDSSSQKEEIQYQEL